MTIFYQMLVHDIIKRTQVYESIKTTNEEKIMFQEILELNEERLRKDADEQEKLLRIDAKRSLQRLSNYCDDIHSIFMNLDFKSIFDNYHKVHESKAQLQKALALELSDIGLIQYNQLEQKSEPMELDQVVRGVELEITEKAKNETTFQRFVPKRKVPLDYLQGMKALQPIGIVKPERRQAIHIIVEQLIVPNKEHLAQTLQKERELKEKNQQLDQQERLRIEADLEIKRIEQLKNDKLMEAQHLELANHYMKENQTGSKNKTDKKKLAEKFQKNQENRANEIEKKEKIARSKEIADQKIREANEAKKLAATKKVTNGIVSKKKKTKVQITVEQNEELNDDSNARESKLSDRKGRKNSASPSSNLIEVKIDSKYQQKNFTGLSFTSGVGDKKDSFDEIRTQGMGDQIKDAMEDVENKILSKYNVSLQEAEDFDKKELNLKNKDFEQLFEIFQTSLGKTITSKDYNMLFASSNIDNFVKTSNDLQIKYLRQQNQGMQGSSSLTVDTQKSAPQADPNHIPYQDLICADIDGNGEFQGLKIRPEIAKVLFVSSNKDVSKVAKVLKTVNYMNRLLLEPNADFMLGKKKTGKEVSEAQCQCNLINDEVKTADNEFNTTQEIEVPSKKLSSSEALLDKDDVIKEFFQIVRSHCINVLMRMNPEKQSYYKLVWENQKPEDLLNYKLPQVYDEVAESGITEEDREYLETMNVLQYFKTLFNILNEKLSKNVPTYEKQDLDMKKWIWNGDSIPDGTEQQQAQVKKKTIASQTPTQWLEKNKNENLKEHSQDSKKVTIGILQTASKSTRSTKKPTFREKHAQTGEELLSLWFKQQQASQNAAANLKEQIDKLMGEEISKTIESMHTYIDRVRATQKIEKGNSNDFVKKPEVTNNTQVVNGKRERLKQQINSFRNDLEDSSQRVQAEIEDHKFKQKNIGRNAVIKEAMKTQKLESPKSKSKSKDKFPFIGSFDEPHRNQSASFDSGNKQKLQAGRYPKLSLATKSQIQQNPFKKNIQQSQNNQQSLTLHNASTQSSHIEKIGRTNSGRGSIPQNHVSIRLDLSDKTIERPDSNRGDFQNQTFLINANSSRTHNFFTGEKRELRQGPVRAELYINSIDNQNNFLSPRISRISQSKQILKTPNNQEIIQVSPFHRISNSKPVHLNVLSNTSTQQRFDPKFGIDLNMSLTQTEGFKKGVPSHKNSLQMHLPNQPSKTPLLQKQNPKTATRTVTHATGNEQYISLQANKRNSFETVGSDYNSAIYGHAFDPSFVKKANYTENEINRISIEDEY